MRSTCAPPSPRPSTLSGCTSSSALDVEVARSSHRGSSARAPRRRRRWSSRRAAPRGRARAPPTARRGWSTDRARTPAPGATGTPRRPAPSMRSRRRGTPGARPLGEDRGAHVGLGHAGGALGDRQVLDRVVRRAAAERVRRAQPAEQPLPVRADLRDDARAVGVLPLHAREPVAPVGLPRAAAERERDRDAALARRGREHVDLAVPHGAVAAGGAGHDRAVHRVGRPLAHGADQRGELVGGGERARHLAPVDRLVQLEPVGARQPTAPASTPSATRSAMRPMSSSVAGSLAAPRSPIT